MLSLLSLPKEKKLLRFRFVNQESGNLLAIINIKDYDIFTIEYFAHLALIELNKSIISFKANNLINLYQVKKIDNKVNDNNQEKPRKLSESSVVYLSNTIRNNNKINIVSIYPCDFYITFIKYSKISKNAEFDYLKYLYDNDGYSYYNKTIVKNIINNDVIIYIQNEREVINISKSLFEKKDNNNNNNIDDNLNDSLLTFNYNINSIQRNSKSLYSLYNNLDVSFEDIKQYKKSKLRFDIYKYKVYQIKTMLLYSDSTNIKEINSNNYSLIKLKHIKKIKNIEKNENKRISNLDISLVSTVSSKFDLIKNIRNIRNKSSYENIVNPNNNYFLKKINNLKLNFSNTSLDTNSSSNILRPVDNCEFKGSFKIVNNKESTDWGAKTQIKYKRRKNKKTFKDNNSIKNVELKNKELHNSGFCFIKLLKIVFCINN